MESSKLSQLWFDEYVPIEGTVDLVRRLKEAGIEVLFLSDNAPDRVAYLDSRYKFLGKFTGGVFSHITKVRKPDQKMYKAVLDIASHPAEECVFIDDKPHLLEPAKDLGMHVIAFKSPEQVEKELQEIGLNF
ncbi:HAD-IA family hydrolase [Candidatus Peregrinibacteria bacterium]|nr:HAD-IA family hydrolase [Candidatus Peregrinibacteria bacterium]